MLHDHVHESSFNNARAKALVFKHRGGSKNIAVVVDVCTIKTSAMKVLSKCRTSTHATRKASDKIRSTKISR